MYRTQQRMAKAEAEAKEGELNIEFINRVTQLPVVNSAWDYAFNTYGRIKDHNKLFDYTLTTAEKSVLFAAEQAMPVVHKFEKQLHVVDDLACKGLVKLEEKAPIITKPPDEIIGETKKLYTTTVQNGVDKYEGLKNYGSETVKAAKEYGVNKAVGLLTSPYGLQVISSLDGALNLTENAVDYYLPPLEDEKEEKKGDAVVDKVSRLSSKMRRRVYKHALVRLGSLQKRSQESLSKLNYTVDLIQYAKDNLNNTNQKVFTTIEAVQKHGQWIWEELKKDEDEENKDTNTEKNWEQQVLSVARQLTKQMVRTYSGATSVVQLLPDNVQTRLSLARDYSVELYSQFSKTTHLEEISGTVLKQVQERIKFIEETFVNYLGTILSSQPLSWLVTNNKDDGTDADVQKQPEH